MTRETSCLRPDGFRTRRVPKLFLAARSARQDRRCQASWLETARRLAMTHIAAVGDTLHLM